MSAVASFTKIPKTALDGLKQAAIPKKRLFGAPRDNFFDYLRKNGEEAAEYKWSGYVLATLLSYLEEKHQIDLMQSDYQETARHLSQARNGSIFILSDSHKQRYLSRLAHENFSEAELKDYFNEFNETNEEEIGAAMVDGIKTFRQSLQQVDADSVIVLCIA